MKESDTKIFTEKEVRDSMDTLTGGKLKALMKKVREEDVVKTHSLLDVAKDSLGKKGPLICPYKHTDYQPEDDWCCPRCGASSKDGDGLVIEYSVTEEALESRWGDCEKLHIQDECKCYTCGYSATGVTVAKRLKKLANLVTCPHCKGKGVVPRS